MPEQFSRTNITSRTYLISGLLARGTNNTLISQSGVGKTYLSFDMAVAVALGKPFLGLKTVKSRVFVVDQDQPADDSNMRMSQFLNYHKVDESENLITSFNQDELQLRDGSLLKATNEVNPDLLIVDSLSTVSAGLNLNDPTDSQKFKNFHRSCTNKSITILFLHHVSDKKVIGYNDFLTCDAGSLSMYSSVFTQAIDGYFICYNPNKGKDLSSLLVRPVMKRYKINCKTFETSMEQTDSTLHFAQLKEMAEEEGIEMTKEEKIIMGLFEDNPAITIKQMYERAEGRIGFNKTYSIAEILLGKGYLDCRNIGRQKNIYRMTDEGRRALEQLKAEEPERREG